MGTILSKLTEMIQQVKTQPITDYEKNEMKNAILDRIGCGLGAKRLGVGQETSSYIKENQCQGVSTIWGTDMKTQAHLAALVNGARAHSMIPATIALGEQHGQVVSYYYIV